VLEVVDVPIIAARGIGTGRAMVAALAVGASAVRVGTRFVAAEEADAHAVYVDHLIAARAEDTVYPGV
jgi:NAD(P)H-dependent flavin oxidoreductase YrpB (nitropropane dioxygenase family)